MDAQQPAHFLSSPAIDGDPTAGLLRGRVAVVTGAAHGPKAALGADMARALADAGAAVVAADRRDCRSITEEIRSAGGIADAVETDVADEQSIDRLIETTVALHGRVDILVNAAAVASNVPPIPLQEITADAWDEVMAINVRGPFLCARACLPFFRSQGYGKIINVGSTTMLEGMPDRLHYVTTKAAIVGMTRALARELGPDGVRVNTLSLGLVTTQAATAAFADRPEVLEAVRAARSMPGDVEPGDVRGTLVYLASHLSDAVTGQTLIVDRGAAMT